MAALARRLNSDRARLGRIDGGLFDLACGDLGDADCSADGVRGALLALGSLGIPLLIRGDKLIAPGDGVPMVISSLGRYVH